MRMNVQQFRSVLMNNGQRVTLVDDGILTGQDVERIGLGIAGKPAHSRWAAEQLLDRRIAERVSLRRAVNRDKAWRTA